MSERNDELPPGWAEARLDDLGEWQGGGTPSKSKSVFWTNGNVPWVSPKDMKTFYIDDTEDHITDEAVEKSAAKLLQPSSVLVVTRSGILQRTLPVAINRVSVTTNQDLKSLVPTNGVEPKFVAHFLKAYDSPIRDECSKDGTTVASIDLPKLKAFRFMLPPLAEQRRIVAKIETLQERSRLAREALLEVGTLLEQFRQSVLAAAFRGDLTADWRAAHPEVEPASELLRRIRAERRRRREQAELAKYEAKGQKPPQNWKDKYREPEPVDDSDLPELPKGWVWATWESILSLHKGSFKRGPFGSELKKSIFVASGYKVYEQYCPINDDCSYVRYYITPEKYEELKAFAVKAGDFLISCSGVTLGRITQVPNDFEEGIINQALLRVRINNGIVNDQFFLMLFRSPYFQRQIFDNATGSAIPNVNGVKDLKAIPVPVPPMAEQLEVLERLEERLGYIRRIDEDVKESNAAFDRLDHATLAKAFRGELVPQDPNDEPASVLLERIRAQPKRQAKAQKQTSKSHQASKLGKKSSRLEPQQLMLEEVLRSAD